jgi:hypothetical protein
MTIKKDALYEEEYNCLVSDLVDGFPPADNREEGAKMYAWDEATKKLTYIFKKVFGAWHKF